MVLINLFTILILILNKININDKNCKNGINKIVYNSYSIPK